MDILTGLSILFIASFYLVWTVSLLLKQAQRYGTKAANASPNERPQRDGFRIQDDYPPNKAG